MEKIMQLSDRFYIWLFEFVGSDCFSRYRKADHQAEYGIHISEYVNTNTCDAIEDAKEYFDKLSLGSKKDYLETYRSHCNVEIDVNRKESNAIDSALTSL